MNSYENYYMEKLYPLQDGVLNIVKKLNTPFYLTGGTALSRFYFNHRFSDDLDFFINNNENYEYYIGLIYQNLITAESNGIFKLDYERQSKSKDFTRFNLLSNDNPPINLRIDMVNDVAKHYGDFEEDIILGQIDSWRNILSNKISAIFRYEPKDIADIWIISRNKEYDWQEIIAEAKTKEMGIDPVVIFEILKSFPKEYIDSIKWNIDVDEKSFIDDLFIIADDILQGKENSLIDSQ